MTAKKTKSKMYTSELEKRRNEKSKKRRVRTD